MPTPGQGNQWLCDRCGLGFRDYNDAHQHEMQCDPYSNRKRRRPASPSATSKANISSNNNTNNNNNNNAPFNYKTVEDQHYFPIEIEQTPNQSYATTTTSTKTPSNNEPRFKSRMFSAITPFPSNKQLSPLDIITCQNVEVFKASAGDVADHEGSSGMTVNKGQIGIRCIHCAKNPFVKAEYHSVFPGSLGSVAGSLQLMTRIHFQKCTALDPETRNRLQATRNSFRAEQDDEEWYLEAFIEYCLDVCKKLNIVNRIPPQTGIVLGKNKVNTTTPTSTPGAAGGYLNDGGIVDSNLQSSSVAETRPSSSIPQQQHGMQSQYQQPSNASTEQYPSSSGQIRNEEKLQAPSSRQMQQSTVSQSKSGSPPSLYDSPGSGNFPYFQNQQGFWECRYCWGLPYNQRVQGCFWQSTQPPNRAFMEQHLNLCQNRGGNSNFSTPTQNQILYQANQYDNMNQQWSTPKNNQSSFYGNIQAQHSPQAAAARPPIPRPPSVPSQFSSTEGMNPQEAYAYQQMQMYNQMQMYGQNSQFDQNFTFPQQCMFPGNQGADPMMYQKNPMAMRSEQNLKEILDYLRNEEKIIEERFDSVEEGEKRILVQDDDKALLTDYFFHVVKQLRFCRFSESDRKTRGGKRDNIKVGFGGLKCVHCSDTQNSRKFFWSNVDRLANSFAEIPGHVLKCRRCPANTKQALMDLKARHSDQMSKLPRGSQKVFFRRMWRRLHDTKERLSLDSLDGGESPRQPQSMKNNEDISNGTSEIVAQKDANDVSAQGNIIVGRSTEAAAKALAEYAQGKKPVSRILLAIDEDKSWLSDVDCFVRSKLEVFCATQNDVAFAESDRKYPITVGQVGIRCIQCAISEEGARGTAVYFPPYVKAIYENVREFHKIHLVACPCATQECKDKLSTLKGSTSLSSVLRRYYIQAAEALGIHDTDDGMRGGGEAKPIGRRKCKDKDLSDSIRHMESSNHEFLELPSVEHVTKRRKLGEQS